MTRLLTAAALLLAGCAKTPVEAPAMSGEAKPGAPVEISADLGADAAIIDLVFGSAGSDVTVSAWGTGDLTVAVEPMKLGDVVAGSTLTMNVEYQGMGSLAVSVDGAFGGIDSSSVQSFTVGERTPVDVPVRTVDGVPVNAYEGSTP